jgi:predicted MFS family arabinose efflux permease
MGTILAVILGRIAFGYQVQTVASLGPDLIGAFSIDLATLGTLMALYMLPGTVTALPYGFLARFIGDRNVIAAGLALMTVGSLVSADAAGPFLLGVGRVIAGAGAVALTVLQGKILADRTEGTRFVHAMSVLVGAFPVGVGLAQLTQVRAAHWGGWSVAFLLGAGLAAIALVVFLATWSPRAAPDLRRGMSWPSRRECILVVLSGLIWTAYNAGYFNFLAYMPTYLARHGHPSWVADVTISMATWGNLPSIVAGGFLATRFGPDRVFVAGSVLCVVAVTGVYFADWPLLWGLMFGTLASIHAGVIVAKGTLSARPENRAVGMGLFYTTYYFGGAIVHALCGRAADAVGDPSGAFLCAGLLASLSIPIYFVHKRVAASRAESGSR